MVLEYDLFSLRQHSRLKGGYRAFQPCWPDHRILPDFTIARLGGIILGKTSASERKHHYADSLQMNVTIRTLAVSTSDVFTTNNQQSGQ